MKKKPVRNLQVHFLHAFPVSTLNRDQSGLAKRMPFGDAVRLRISSQCLKWHWRHAAGADALSTLDVPMSVRSRGILDLIARRLEARGLSESMALACARSLREGGLLDAGDKKYPGREALHTAQAVLLGQAEIDYLVGRVAAVVEGVGTEAEVGKRLKTFLKEEKKNLEAMRLGCGLEAALFGRMVTSDVLASRDASIHVAHAFTVHKPRTEVDFLGVVDDLITGSRGPVTSGFHETELGSGLYYGYLVIDLPQLVANLEGVSPREWLGGDDSRRELASRVVERIIRLVATVTPGAKLGSTAPYTWASFMMVEASDLQPRSLAGAFEQAIPVQGGGGTLLQRSVHALGARAHSMDQAFGSSMERRFLCIENVQVPGAHQVGLDQLAVFASSAALSGQA